MNIKSILNFYSVSAVIILYALYINHSSAFILKTNTSFKKISNVIFKFFFVYFIIILNYNIFNCNLTPYDGFISICKTLALLCCILTLNQCIITKSLIVHNGKIILRKNITNYCLNGSVLDIETKDTTIKIDLTDDIKESVLSKVKVIFK